MEIPFSSSLKLAFDAFETRREIRYETVGGDCKQPILALHSVIEVQFGAQMLALYMNSGCPTSLPIVLHGTFQKLPSQSGRPKRERASAVLLT